MKLNDIKSKYATDGIWSQVNTDVWDWVRNQIVEQVKVPVNALIWDQVKDQVNNDVWDQIEPVEIQVKDQVLTIVNDQVIDNLK